jgi:hypothetical protein
MYLNLDTFFGAISIKLGALEYMQAPKMTYEYMSKFLAKISKKYPPYFHLMVVDGASSHKAKDLILPV